MDSANPMLFVGGERNVGGDGGGTNEGGEGENNHHHLHHDEEGGERKVEEGGDRELLVVHEWKRDGDSPPHDDCCPICFGNFTFACKTDCGHWFCANCILQLWNYRQALQKCKCPICSRLICKLTPEASLLNQQEGEVVDILKSVHKYNRRFQGGLYGFMGKILASPDIIKRLIWALMNPDRFDVNYNAMRLAGMVFSFIYNLCRLDFTAAGYVGTSRVVDLVAIILVFGLCLVGLLRRRILRRRVRRLAAAGDHHV